MSDNVTPSEETKRQNQQLRTVLDLLKKYGYDHAVVLACRQDPKKGLNFVCSSEGTAIAQHYMLQYYFDFLKESFPEINFDSLPKLPTPGESYIEVIDNPENQQAFSPRS